MLVKSWFYDSVVVLLYRKKPNVSQKMLGYLFINLIKMVSIAL